jgi:D-alanyl-D-alanine carboxypeptidase
VPNGQHITITELLDMRSGLYNYTESLELNQTLDTNPTKAGRPTSCSPSPTRTRRTSPRPGLPLLEYQHGAARPDHREADRPPGRAGVSARIFTPLGLRNTHLPPRTSNALPAPYPNGYQFGTNVETMATQVLPPDQQAAARAGILKPLDATHDNPSWAWTAGSGISTAEDLAPLCQALVGGGLLNDAMQKTAPGQHPPHRSR